MFSKKIFSPNFMWEMFHLRRSLCPHNILSSLMCKYFYVKLHKLYYFVYA